MKLYQTIFTSYEFNSKCLLDQIPAAIVENKDSLYYLWL